MRSRLDFQPGTLHSAAGSSPEKEGILRTRTQKDKLPPLVMQLTRRVTSCFDLIEFLQLLYPANF